jgi:cob(I)alamin adenosyltransferase
MGHRLSSITTRTGDSGLTGLADGSRVSKDSPRIVAMGEVDELNSMLGLLLCETLPEDIARSLHASQHELFDLGGELAIPGHLALRESAVARLEAHATVLNARLSPLRDFILPGGSRAAAIAHLARTICRRAERAVIGLVREQAISPTVGIYLNRLSDYLFIVARALNQANGVTDVLWNPGAIGETDEPTAAATDTPLP